MTFFSSKLIVLLLLVTSLEISSSKNRIILRSELPKKVQIQRSYVNLLNSLIKVNQERVAALKKLYVLNSITYGKDGLRSTIENKLGDYDIREERLISTLKHILDELKREPKTAIDENDINKILQTNDQIFVISNETDNKEMELTDKQGRNKVKKALRNKDSDNDSSKEKSSDKSDSKDSKSNEESIKEVKGNTTQGRSYYFEYGCGRGRIRCIKACKEAYRYACDIYYCRSSLRDELRSSCKIACREWFY